VVRLTEEVAWQREPSGARREGIVMHRGREIVAPLDRNVAAGHCVGVLLRLEEGLVGRVGERLPRLCGKRQQRALGAALRHGERIVTGRAVRVRREEVARDRLTLGCAEALGPRRIGGRPRPCEGIACAPRRLCVGPWVERPLLARRERIRDERIDSRHVVGGRGLRLLDGR
jgi:hypothetical protein